MIELRIIKNQNLQAPRLDNFSRACLLHSTSFFEKQNVKGEMMTEQIGP